MKRKQWWVDFLKGASLGLGMIPGVSAGTMAVVVGIFDKMIDALASFRSQIKKSVQILLPIILGLLLGCAAILIAVHFGYSSAPFAITCLFAGLILGSLPTITKELRNQKINLKAVLLVLSGFIVASGLGVLSACAALFWNFKLDDLFLHPTWWIYLLTFVSGIIAAVACVIPGISGAMILFLFGLYTPIVNLFLDKSHSMFVDHSRLGSGILLTLCLLIGALVGLVIVSKAMKTLLEKKRVATFEVVLGFVLGSIVSMFVSNNMVVVPDGAPSYWIYATTPVWEWFVGPVLLIVATVVFSLLTKRMLLKQNASSMNQ